MALLTTLTSSTTSAQSLAPVTPESGGDAFVNDGRILLYIKNTNASTRTVTIVSAGVILGALSIGDVVFTVAQNEEKIVGPFPPRYFNNDSGLVSIGYSGVTDLKVRTVRML